MPSKQKVLRKENLVSELAKRSKVSKQVVDEVLKQLPGVCVKHLSEGLGVRIGGLGTLVCKSYEKRKGKNPKTGKDIMIPARRAVRFRQSETLKDQIN